MNLLTRFLHEDDAATAVEYAVLLALILMALLGGIGTVGAQTGGMWAGIVSALQAVGFFP